MENNKNSPEFGGRIQLPVTKGEIGLTYHHRNASSKELAGFPAYNNIAENRYAIDGKWDVEVGVWFEAVHINKAKVIISFKDKNKTEKLHDKIKSLIDK